MTIQISRKAFLMLVDEGVIKDAEIIFCPTDEHEPHDCQGYRKGYHCNNHEVKMMIYGSIIDDDGIDDDDAIDCIYFECPADIEDTEEFNICDEDMFEKYKIQGGL